MTMARTVASATSRTAATATYRITAAATAVVMAMGMTREPQGATAALARRKEHVQGLGEKS